MADRIQNLISRRHTSRSMVRIVDSQWEAEITRAHRVVNKRPPFIESSSQPQPQRPIQHATRNRRTTRSSAMNQEVDMIPLEVVDSDADSNSDPQRFNAEDDGADGVAEVEGEAILMVATDPDMLNCSICHYPLCMPIFLCDDGHTSCFTFRIREENKCPSCSVPKVFKHCRGMEKLIESLRVECKNKKYGCKETLMNHKKAEHENICPHTVCFCPVSSCGFASSCKLMYNHFSRHHSAIPFVYNTIFNLYVEPTQKHIILQERNEKVIFIVNHAIQRHGRVFNVDCVGPDTFKSDFVYRLTMKFMDICLSMECVPEIYAKWQEHTPDNNYLTIPSRLTGFGLQVASGKLIELDRIYI